MRKRHISRVSGNAPDVAAGGLSLTNAVTVEITSEDETHPIECALEARGTRGWRAAEPGPQLIRLLFDEPQELKRIGLVFEETEFQRTQEFTLAGRGITESPSEKSFVSSGTLALRAQYVRPRITTSNSQM